MDTPLMVACLERLEESRVGRHGCSDGITVGMLTRQPLKRLAAGDRSADIEKDSGDQHQHCEE